MHEHVPGVGLVSQCDRHEVDIGVVGRVFAYQRFGPVSAGIGQHMAGERVGRGGLQAVKAGDDVARFVMGKNGDGPRGYGICHGCGSGPGCCHVQLAGFLCHPLPGEFAFHPLQCALAPGTSQVRLRQQAAQAICHGIDRRAIHPQPRLAMQDRRSRPAGQACQARFAAGSRFDEDHAKAFIVAVDLAVGHGKYIAGILPARQIRFPDRANAMDHARQAEVMDQAVKIVGILAYPANDIAQRHPFGMQFPTARIIWSKPLRRDSLPTENSSFSSVPIPRLTQTGGIQARPEYRDVDTGIDERDARRVDAHAPQGVTRMVAVGNDPVGMTQGEPHRLEFPAVPPAGEFFAMGIDGHRPERQARHPPCHQPFRQRAEGMHGLEAVRKRQPQRPEEKRAYIASDSGRSQATRLRLRR